MTAQPAPRMASPEALQAFKAYVHERLDKMGVPVDPPGEHRDAGCRVGQRLDLVVSLERVEAALRDPLDLDEGWIQTVLAKLTAKEGA